MEDQTSTNKNLEDLFRQGLDRIDAEPDTDLWNAIEARQKDPNKKLRLRHYARIAVPVAALFVAGLGIGLRFWPHRPGGTPEQSTFTQYADQTPAKQADELAHAQTTAHNVTLPNADRLAPAPVGRPAPFRLRVNTVPPKRLYFRAEDGLEYENPVTGTSLQIRPGILVHADGRPVAGEVELQLMEYRNPSDYLASGIPMHYTDERGEYHFNSGGMFEVNVLQGAERLFIAPGQQCDLRFSPTHQLTQASLFYFDENNDGQWKYEANAAFAAEDGALPALPPVVAEAVAIRDNIQRNAAPACLPPDLPVPGEIDVARWIREGVRTGYELAHGRDAIPAWFRHYSDQKDEVLLGRLEQSLIHIVHHRDHQEMFFPEDIKGIFTELKAFKGAYFVFDNDRNHKQLKLDGFWDRVSVVQEQGAVCTISLLGKEGLTQFYATLIPSPGNEHFNVEEALQNYRTLRDERQQNFETRLKRWRRFLFAAPIFASESEWCMPTAEWCAYFDEQNPLMRKRYDALVQAGAAEQDSVAQGIWNTWRRRVLSMRIDDINRKLSPTRGLRSDLVYALKLSHFGLYNCDQIFNLWRGHEAAYLQAYFQTAEGAVITPKSMSVMEKSTRLFFTLPSPGKMPCLPGRKLDFVLTDEQGRSYILPRDRYARRPMHANQAVTFQVEDVTEKTGTPGDWAELLDM